MLLHIDEYSLAIPIVTCSNNDYLDASEIGADPGHVLIFANQQELRPHPLCHTQSTTPNFFHASKIWLFMERAIIATAATASKITSLRQIGAIWFYFSFGSQHLTKEKVLIGWKDLFWDWRLETEIDLNRNFGIYIF